MQRSLRRLACVNCARYAKQAQGQEQSLLNILLCLFRFGNILTTLSPRFESNTLRLFGLAVSAVTYRTGHGELACLPAAGLEFVITADAEFHSVNAIQQLHQYLLCLWHVTAAKQIGVIEDMVEVV